MKVLFISSGKLGEVGYLVKNQGESLSKAGLEIDYYTINGNGFWGYLKNVPQIRKTFKREKYNLVHAHYSLSAFATSLAGRFPLVVSLMGSDAYSSVLWRWIIKFFYKWRWNATIVKTQKMKDLLKISRAFIIPNGVNTERFKPSFSLKAREKISFTENKKLILFIADPSRHEKNFPLAIETIRKLNRNDIELMPLFNTPNEVIPDYMNAADALILTSKWEGGVNVIKEAMACNLPIVSVDVGDVKQNITGLKNCFVCNHNASELAEKLNEVLSSGERSNGRERIFDLKLDEVKVAEKIIDIYKKTLNK